MSEQKQKTVVTGGAGFIGSHIAEALVRQGDYVTVVDNLRTGHRENLDGLDLEFVEGDIRDKACLTRAFQGADTVFHLAAALSVPESMDKPEGYVDINCGGMLSVIAAARECGVRRIVFSSSAAIYGDNPSLPKVETMTPEPLSPYAVTKLDGEYYVNMFQTDALTAVSLRYFNVFGPRQDPDSPYAAAVPIFIARALADQDISIYGDGAQTRDFVYVKDVVSANLHARTAAPGVYNIGNNSTTVIQSLAEDIVALTQSHSSLRNIPERQGEVKHSRACIDKIEATGWEPSFPFDSALRKTIEYYRNAE